MSGIALGTTVIGLVGNYGNQNDWWQGDGKEDEDYSFATPPSPTFHRAPEFAETSGARKAWFEKLQESGDQPGFGAITPDFGDIWKRARKQVSQYFTGGPEGGEGLLGRVKASAARRNVADSPAMEAGIGRLGAKEADILGDISVEQGIQEAKFGEAGRQNWLSNIAKMSGMKVPGVWQSSQGYRPTTVESPYGDLASAGGEYLAQQGERDWYENILDKYFDTTQPGNDYDYPAATQKSIKDELVSEGYEGYGEPDLGPAFSY